MKLSKLIESNQKSERKTKNNELYYKVICALCKDDEYKTIIARETKNGIFTDELQLSNEFKRILASFLKQNSSCTESEAFKAASSFELTADQAKTLATIIHESDYITMKNLGKKIQYQEKPDFNIILSMDDVPETVRVNPKDRSLGVKISAHDRLKVDQSINKNMKRTIKLSK